MGASGNLSVLKQPNYTWRCQLVKGTHWSVEEGNQPNWIHRKLQSLFFGIKWERI